MKNAYNFKHTVYQKSKIVAVRTKNEAMGVGPHLGSQFTCKVG